MFSPHRLVYFSVVQKFEKFERTDQQKEGTESGDKTREQMEKSRLAEQLEGHVSRANKIDPKKFPTFDIASYVSDDTVDNIKKTIEWYENLFAKRETIQKTNTFATMMEEEGDLRQFMSRGAIARFNVLKAKYQQGSESDNEAFAEFVMAQFVRLGTSRAQFSEYDQLSRLPGIAETCKNLQISVTSEKGVSGQLRGLISRDNFGELNLEQKKSYLKNIRETLGKAPEGAAAVNSQKSAILADSAVPDTWKQWLSDPQNPKYGTDKEGKKWTTASVAEWINSELPALKLSTGRYQNILQQGRTTIDKHGLATLSTTEFQKKSRGERNEYLDGLQKKIGEHDAQFAQKMETAKVSEGAEAKGISAAAAESVQKKEKREEQGIKDLGEQLKQSTVAKDLRKKFTDRRAKLENQGKDEENQADEIANLRSGKNKEGGIGAFFKNILGGKVESVAGGDSKDTPEEQAKKKSEKERLDNEAANQVATEVVGDGKDGKRDKAVETETRRLLGLTETANNDDLANSVKLLAMADPNSPDYAKEMKILFNDNNKPFKKMVESGKCKLFSEGGHDAEPSAMRQAA